MLGLLHWRRRRAVADRVDEAVRQGGGGSFDRQRPAGSDASQLGAVDARSLGGCDLAAEDRPLRIGGDTWMDRIGEPSRRRFACDLKSAGLGDAPVEPPLHVAARTIVGGRPGRADVGVRDVACSPPDGEITDEAEIAQGRDGPGGCGLSRPACRGGTYGRAMALHQVTSTVEVAAPEVVLGKLARHGWEPWQRSGVALACVETAGDYGGEVAGAVASDEHRLDTEHLVRVDSVEDEPLQQG